jgi:hypothetical protein
MSVEKLERVMWRLRSRNPGKTVIDSVELRRCIMLEIGTDPRTYYANKKSLILLKWLKRKGTRALELTNEDIVNG